MRVLENAWTKVMRNETLLFDSISSPIPELRRDIQVIPIQDNGKNLLYFHDSMGYTSPNFALDQQVEPILSLITGSYSISKIKELLNGAIDSDNLLEFVQLLDQHRVLNSKHFTVFSNRIEKDFEAGAIRKPMLAGESYPAQPEQINAFLNDLFDGVADVKTKAKKALYAPHIDLRVGANQYAEAFSAIKKLTPKRVVILATSHYAGYYESFYESSPFVGSTKEYSIPGTTFQTDHDYLKELNQTSAENGFTLKDRAHRIEHSIEIHLLFLSHIWKHNFKIVPILIGGLDELFYHSSGEKSKQLDRFSNQIQDLDNDDTFYLISGDLSHIGKKFGDPLPASQLRPEVEKTDKHFIGSALSGKADKLLDVVAAEYDATRICGFPPLYTFLKCFPGLTGTELNYHWWDESERESAVSFGSILYS